MAHVEKKRIITKYGSSEHVCMISIITWNVNKGNNVIATQRQQTNQRAERRLINDNNSTTPSWPRLFLL